MSQYGLEEVYSPSSKGIQAVVNIIFVHGLFGGRQTWTTQCGRSSSHISQQARIVTRPSSRLEETPLKNATITRPESSSVFWPSDLLPQAVPDARVFTWGYDADVHHWGSSASQNTIHDHAGNLLSDIANQIVGDSPEPLIFIVHSLGGIVIKDALNQSSQTEGTRLKTIAPATYGVLFLGTPHRGSKSASIGKLAYNVTVAATRRPNLKLLQALERNSETLDRVGDSFRQTVLKLGIKLCSFREEKETRKWLVFNTMVVEPDSAKIGDGKEEIGSIPENHRGMSKFASISDLGFKRISAVLRTWIDDIKRFGKIHATESYYDCLASLNHAEARSRIAEVTDSHQETFHWLYDPEQVQFSDWLHHDGNDMAQIFWIQGKPGSGKSTLMKFAMRHNRTLEMLHRPKHLQWIFAGFFFHDRGSSAQKTYLAMLQEVVHQLLGSSDRLWPVVKPMYEELMKRQRTKSPQWDVNILQTVLTTISQLRYLDLGILIFLDALDEHDGDNEQLTSLMWKLVKTSAGSRLKLKICLASRPWTVFTSSFSGCPGFAIHDHTREDIHIYTNSKLQEATVGASVLLKNEAYSGKLNDLSEKVTYKAQGVFIWVRLVVSELAKGLRDGTPLAVLEQKLSEMPSELKDLYIHTLKRIELDYQRETRVMLQLALCSFSPLPLRDFVACSSYCRWNDEHEFDTEDSMVRHLASRSGGLLEVFSSYIPPTDQNPTMDVEVGGGSGQRNTDTESETSSSAYLPVLRVQFIHQTVREFVAQFGADSGLLSDVSDSCSGYLHLLRYGARRGAESDEITQDLFQYAKAIEINSPQEVKLMADTLDNSRLNPFYTLHSALWNEWMSTTYLGTTYLGTTYLGADDFTRKDKFVCLAIGANLVEYVRHMFFQDNSIIRKIGKMSLLHLAVAGSSLVQGQEDRPAMVKLLLDLGIPPDEGSSGIFQMEMSDTTGPRRLDVLFGPEVQVSVLYFMMLRKYKMVEAIVRELLEHGANPNVYDVSPKAECIEWHSVEHCVRYESEDMIKLFLRHGAEPCLVNWGRYSNRYLFAQLLSMLLTALLRRDIGVVNAVRGHIQLLQPSIEPGSSVVEAFAVYSILGAMVI